MTIQLRYSLGQSLGSNIVADPTFILGCPGPWTCEKDWTIAGNTATFFATGPGDVLRGIRQNALLTQGQRYRLTFDYLAPAGFPASAFFGDYLVNIPFGTANSPQSVSVDGTCLSANTDFGIYGNDGAGNFGIENVYIYPLNWNPPISDEPRLDTKVKSTQDGAIDSLSLSFIDSIVFWGDGYEYFTTNYNEKKTPLRIEYNDGSGWQDLTEGEVYFQDRVIDYEKKTIKLKYEDKSIMNVLNKGKDTKVKFFLDTTANWDLRILTASGGDAVFDLIDLHDPASGAYTDTGYVFRLYYVFMIIVHQISELDIHIDASPLQNMSDLGGAATDFLGIIIGKSLRTPTNLDTMYISFQDVVNEFHKLSNIAIVPRIVGGVKTLVMELRNSFIADSGIDFTNVPKIKELKGIFNFRSFSIGYNKSEIDIPNTEDQYVSEFDFYNGNKNLVSEWIQSGSIIWAVANSGNTSYDGDMCLIEYYDSGAGWKSQIFAGNTYNGDIDTEDNILRFADVMTGNYIRQLAGGGESEDIVAGTALYTRVFTFDYPLTLDQYLILLNNPYAFIDITSDYIDLSTGLAIDTQGYLIELDYDMIRGIATFKMLVQ